MESTHINWIIGILAGVVLVATLYFNSILSPSQMDEITSHAGGPEGSRAVVHTVQFTADCIMADGREILGTVSVPSTMSPGQLEQIDLKPIDGGQPVTFGRGQARCVYAP